MNLPKHVIDRGYLLRLLDSETEDVMKFMEGCKIIEARNNRTMAAINPNPRFEVKFYNVYDNLSPEEEALLGEGIDGIEFEFSYPSFLLERESDGKHFVATIHGIHDRWEILEVVYLNTKGDLS